MLRKIPLPIKIFLSFVLFPVFIIIWMGAASGEMQKTMNDAAQNPNIETVSRFLEAWRRIVVSVNNHPENWKKIREAWYKINGSDKVPTDMKREVLEIFKKRGLYLSNEKIIDNYNKSKK